MTRIDGSLPGASGGSFPPALAFGANLFYMVDIRERWDDGLWGGGMCPKHVGSDVAIGR